MSATIETTKVSDRYGNLASRVHICPAIGSVVVERYLDEAGRVVKEYRSFQATVPVDDVWATAERCVRTEMEWADRF
jgi:hypothetical protein